MIYKKVLIILFSFMFSLISMSLYTCLSCTYSQTQKIDISATNSDHFNGPTLDPKWIVINKNSDSNLSLTGTGLRMSASPKNGGSGYYNDYDHALRILQPVNGDWIIETKLNFLPTNNYQGAGIMMCYDDPGSNKCRRVIERGFDPKQGGPVINSVGKFMSYTDETIYFLIWKKGINLTSQYSSDGINWKKLNNFQDYHNKLFAGLFVVRQPWDNNENIYSTADFSYFNITPIYPDIQKVTNASVSLISEKTDVTLNDDILLKLSAVNLISKPKMHIQVIIIPPSGMSVTSAEFSKIEAGQYAADYELEPGDGREIEVKIRPNQIGTFDISGRVVYYFGDDKENSEDYPLDQHIIVRKESNKNNDVQKPIPGFDILLAILGLCFLKILKIKK